jgi:hypothetical protein
MDWVTKLKDKIKNYFSSMYKKSDTMTNDQLSKQGYSPDYIKRIRNRNQAVKQQDELMNQQGQK